MKIETDIIFIDTSIFENENFLRGHKIKQIGELSREDEIEVKIIDIVYNEILGRLRKNLIGAKTVYKQADKSLNVEGKVLKNLTEFDAFYPMPRINIEENYKKLKEKIDKFILDNKIEVINSTDASIKDVFEKYFNLEPPFGEGQKKDEFPDAFILSAIEKWCEDNKHKVYVLSTDGDMINYKSKNDCIIPLDNLADYLDTIIRRKEEKVKLDFIDKSIQENLIEVDSYLRRNNNDDVAFKIYEELTEHVWYEDVEYEPANITEIEFGDYLITDIEDNKISAEIDIVVKLDMNISYNDLSTGIYDKEDGVWFNVEYVSEDKSYIAEYKLIVDFNYEMLEDEDNYFELDGIMNIELEDYEEKLVPNK